MAKKMLIDATHAEETRVVVVDGNKVEEFDFETVNKRQLAGNIYLAKVTRVEPSLQAAFVDYGGNRHGFLAFAEIHPDYYQIPVADRQALIEEERAYAEHEEAEENGRPRRRSGAGSGNGSGSGSRRAARPERAADADAVTRSDDIPGMGVVDLDAEPDEAVFDAAPVAEPAANGNSHGNGNGEEAEAYVAADHASETDDEIESVADEDLSDEIHSQRKPRPRRYKIQEVVKVRQIMLVQVVKEERGNKGAALTTYLSLAGRYCVLMPNTARGGGISRKITNIVDRKKLKEIAGEMEVPQGAGLIIRTAGSQRTRTEIRRDYEYLMRLWEQIRDLTLRSIAPAPVYEEGDLIKRSIRDLYSKEIDEVLVEGDRGYRTAKDFMKMIMPSHAKNVKHYVDQLPLYARFGVESYLGAMFNPTVQLKSGGYIVIGITEALVAIDVNSGRSTKEGSIEDTALKTNIEAAEEIARQLRLRDLAGLIVIDFIDMEERRNNASVEKRLKEKLKTDRARIQVGRISGFGLLEMSRQRLRPGMIEMTTQPCLHCHGTGVIRSDDSMALQILRAIEEEGTRKRSREVLVKAPVAVANYLMNAKRDHIAGIESRYGLSVRIEAAPDLISPDFTLEKFKTATRNVPEVTLAVAAADPLLMAEIDEEDEDIVEEADEAEAAPAAQTGASAAGDEGPKKKKRRRRRKKKTGGEAGANGEHAEAAGDEDEDEGEGAGDEPLTTGNVAAPVAEAPAEAATEAEAPTAKAPRSRGRTRASRSKAGAAAEATAEVADEAVAEQPAEATPVAPKKTSSRARKPRAKAETAAEAAPAPASAPAPAKPTRSRSTRAKPAAEPAAATAPAKAPEAVAEPVAAPLQVAEPAQVASPPVPQPPLDPAPAADAPAKPKKRGWWSLAR
ncbi:MAG: ribonuclease E/G [Rhodobacteraceae bacterium]|nr:ribonuclease E/G [Paracoccaceae bacterium]